MGFQEVGPDLAGDTVTVWWELFDHEEESSHEAGNQVAGVWNNLSMSMAAAGHGSPFSREHIGHGW